MVNEILKARLSILTPEYKWYVSSATYEETINLLGEAESVGEDDLLTFKNGFALFLLCFFNTEQALDFITSQSELPRSLAMPMFSAVLSVLPPDIVEAQRSGYALLNDSITKPANLTTEIAEMEAVLAQAPAVRTMATDMNMVREQGAGEYVSNQAALLQRDSAPAAAPATPPTDPDEARWGSSNHY